MDGGTRSMYGLDTEIVTDSHLRRYLFVTEITLPLVRLLHRYHTKDLLSTNTDHEHSFPKLALVVTQQSCTEDRLTSRADWKCNPSHVTRYRSLSLPTLMNFCKPFERYSSSMGIGFFGSHHLEPGEVASGARPSKSRDIVDLTIKAGAGIKEYKGPMELEGWRPTWVGTSFKLDIGNEEFRADVDGNLDCVLDHLALYVWAMSQRAAGRLAHLTLKCSAVVLDRFIELVSQCGSWSDLGFLLNMSFFICLVQSSTTLPHGALRGNDNRLYHRHNAMIRHCDRRGLRLALAASASPTRN